MQSTRKKRIGEDYFDDPPETKKKKDATKAALPTLTALDIYAKDGDERKAYWNIRSETLGKTKDAGELKEYRTRCFYQIEGLKENELVRIEQKEWLDTPCKIVKEWENRPQDKPLTTTSFKREFIYPHEWQDGMPQTGYCKPNQLSPGVYYGKLEASEGLAFHHLCLEKYCVNHKHVLPIRAREKNSRGTCIGAKLICPHEGCDKVLDFETSAFHACPHNPGCPHYSYKLCKKHDENDKEIAKEPETP